MALRPSPAWRRRAAALARLLRRPSAGQVRVLGALALLLALGCWAVASPVGSSPDDDFHLPSIWCAHGLQEGICEQGPTADSRWVPAELMQADCFKFMPATSAACQYEVDADRMAYTDWGNFIGLYPPVYYWFAGFFVSDDLTRSIIGIRLANATLYVALVAAIYLLVPVGIRRAMLGGILVTAVPLGIFVVSSINPSAWALLASATFLASILGFITAEELRRRLALGIIAGLSFFIGIGARADAAVFAVVAVAAAVILTVQRSVGRMASLAYPLILAAVAVPTFFAAGQSSHAQVDGLSPSFSINRLVSIALDVPSLWAGTLGTWPLGWLDTEMRPIVWVSCLAVFAGVVFIALGNADPRRGLAIGTVALATVVIPIYVQFISGYPVGQVVQPRYILPLMTLLAFTAMIRLDGQAFRLANGQRWVVVAALSVAHAIALHQHIRRYVTGADMFRLNLNQDVEWWWSAGVSPMVVWTVACVAFVGGVILLTREFVVAAPAGGVGTAGADRQVGAPVGDAQPPAAGPAPTERGVLEPVGVAGSALGAMRRMVRRLPGAASSQQQL